MMKHKLLFGFAMLSCIAIAQTTFLPKVGINTTTGDAPYTMSSGLIDGDELPDIVIGTYIGNTLEWYKNNGDNTFTIQPLVTNTLNGLGFLKLADLNGDGFLDLIASAYTNDTLAWYPNDGSGNFTTENIISSSVLGASGFSVGDINNDTFTDIVITAYDSNEVVWFSNDGTGTFTLDTVKIDDTLAAPGAIDMKDIDGDGDLDVVVGTAVYGGDKIEIFRNNLSNDGTVSFTKDATSIATGKTGIFHVSFEDLDGDANLDILATEVSYGGGPTGHFYWYEDNGSGFTETELTTSLVNPGMAKFEDLDNDGFNDLVLGNGASGSGNDLVWFKNNGTGGFDPETVIDATQSQAFVLAIEDFDADGDLDIATCAYNQDALNYFENEKIVLSISDSQLKTIAIYPNPTKDFLSFEGFNTEISVSVFNVLGKQVLNRNITVGEKLDVSKLSNGIYTIKLNNKLTTKFIKE
ncbi:T9SS type A sorting domain-containing protein [Winogradskyella undariae]|uniref:T9SS type A sorting domain-containing protein n=1 Tax=Winogradskyella undariae TaxID=1285465 RepID=UPI00185F3281|nr:T9SS type A sorting domain-containing protein [Winogradskyella undariae]QNK77807.1 T9SS type A sorting domain-containing protein [Winogradskyella sp. PAMC22761]